MAEIAFNKLQMGIQSAHGTAVPATQIFPVDSGTVIDLDRAYRSPEEDYGSLARHQPGRGSYGVRGAEVRIAGDASYELIMYMLEAHLAGGVTPSGSGPYVWAYPGDISSDSTKRLTLEVGTEATQDQWRIHDCLVDELTLSFDALEAPGNSPWKFSATLLGRDRTANALTAALSAPSALETMEGHLTQLYEGSTATAFASLAELTLSLISFSWTSRRGLIRRKRGSASSDTFDIYGFGKRESSFEAMVAMGATAKTDIYDIYNAAGGIVGERRWRVKANGTSPRLFTVDGRVRFTSIPIGDNNGEHVYQVNGDWVYDSTNATDVKATVTNSVATLT